MSQCNTGRVELDQEQLRALLNLVGDDPHAVVSVEWRGAAPGSTEGLYAWVGSNEDSVCLGEGSVIGVGQSGERAVVARDLMSSLLGSGFTLSKEEAQRWVATASAFVRHNLAAGELTAAVWPYRSGPSDNSEHLVLVVSDAAGAKCEFDFGIAGYSDWDIGNPLVPDMSEALHLARLVCHGLGIEAVGLGRP